MFISYSVCLYWRGRVVTNVVRTYDPTPGDRKIQAKGSTVEKVDLRVGIFPFKVKTNDFFFSHTTQFYHLECLLKHQNSLASFGWWGERYHKTCHQCILRFLCPLHGIHTYNQLSKNFESKIVNIFSYPSVLTYVLDTHANNYLTEMFLLSTHNICFG